MLKGYPLRNARQLLTHLHSMTVEEFVAWQQNKAFEIARHHYQHNEMYRQLVGKHFPDDWNDLPVITKQHLQQPLERILTKGVRLKDCHIGSTSGSTGTPFFYAKDKFAHAMTWAIIENRYRWHGLAFSSAQARFYGIPKEFVSNRKERIKDRLMNRHRFSVFDLSARTLLGFTETFRKKKFDYIYGYTGALVLFARFLLSQGLVLKDICPGLKICISTSETATPEDDIILQDAFGVPHIREYGVSETCLVAFDDPGKNWRLTEESLFTETGTGDAIITTSLFNTAMPMVRYQSGDSGLISKERKEIHRSLLSLTGRTNDIIRLPGGKTAAGLSFYYVSRSLLEQTGILKEFIIRQTSPDCFIFDVVSDRELTEAEIILIKHKVSVYLQPGLNVVINRVDTIQRPQSGKLKHFYSEIDGVG